MRRRRTQGALALFFLSLALVVPGFAAAKTPALNAQGGMPPVQRPKSGLARWLSRPVGIHPDLLDHGVVSPFVDLGAPFGYRLGLKAGILDVLTVGVMAQWRDPELGFRWAPELGLALYRGERLALGLRYRYLFHQTRTPAPPEEEGAEPAPVEPLPTPYFFEVTHYLAGSLVWSNGYVSAGLEAGASYRRELDQSQNILDPDLFSMQWRPMTGAMLRLGNDRWGVLLQAMVPSPELTLRFEWRYPLFSLVRHRDPLSAALRDARKRRKRRAAHSTLGVARH